MRIYYNYTNGENIKPPDRTKKHTRVKLIAMKYEETGKKAKWVAFATAVMMITPLQATTLASSSSPWPYLQIYPPVNESDGRMPLYFALMLSFGGDYTSIGALPAVQIALDYINSQPSILPGYSLHYTLTDSQVHIDNYIQDMGYDYYSIDIIYMYVYILLY